MVSNESIRRWVLKFGPIIAKNLREIRPKAHNRWHLDEMVVSIAGRQMYMWRAVDGEGEVLESSSWFSPAATRPQRRGCSASCFDVRASFLRPSLPTNSDPMARRFAKLAFRDCTSKACAPTIEPRIHISRFVDANERRKASNRRSRLSGSFPPIPSFTMFSPCNVT